MRDEVIGLNRETNYRYNLNEKLIFFRILENKVACNAVYNNVSSCSFSKKKKKKNVACNTLKNKKVV